MQQFMVGGLMTALQDGIRGCRYLAYCTNKATEEPSGVFTDNRFLPDHQWQTKVNVRSHEVKWTVWFTDKSLGTVTYAFGLADARGHMLGWRIEEHDGWSASDVVFCDMFTKLRASSREYAIHQELDPNSPLMRTILMVE